MDPIRALDMEFRSGISPSEVDDFANRMDLVRLSISLCLWLYRSPEDPVLVCGI